MKSSNWSIKQEDLSNDIVFSPVLNVKSEFFQIILSHNPQFPKIPIVLTCKSNNLIEKSLLVIISVTFNHPKGPIKQLCINLSGVINTFSPEIVMKTDYSMYYLLENGFFHEGLLSTQIVFHIAESAPFDNASFQHIELIKASIINGNQIQLNDLSSFFQLLTLSFIGNDRILSHSTPSVVVGSLSNTHCLIRLFDKYGAPNVSKYIFIGNYIDKDLFFSILCLKIRYPNTVAIIRADKYYQPDVHITEYENFLCKMPQCACINNQAFIAHSIKKESEIMNYNVLSQNSCSNIQLVTDSFEISKESTNFSMFIECSECDSKFYLPNDSNIPYITIPIDSVVFIDRESYSIERI